MWMMELLEYVDFEVEVLFELLVKLRQVHRLDGDELMGRLKGIQLAIKVDKTNYWIEIRRRAGSVTHGGLPGHSV